MKTLVAGLIISLGLTACSDQLNRSRPYILTTATTGGTYYPVGVALATIAHAQLSESKRHFAHRHKLGWLTRERETA